MMKKIPKQAYTAEFKGALVKRATEVGAAAGNLRTQVWWRFVRPRCYPLSRMCVVHSVSRYRAWKDSGTSESAHLTDAQAVTLILTIHAR